MAVIQKTSFAKDLDRFNVLVNDVNPNSRYFRITELPDTLTGGKNAFLIAGTEELVLDTKIQIEIKDSIGNIIYHEPGEGMINTNISGSTNTSIIAEYFEGVSKVVAIYIYPETTFGPCTLTILGEVDKYEDGNGILTPVPIDWIGKYNVKWQKQLNVNPSLANTTKIRFYQRPQATITEILNPIYTIVSGSKVASAVTQSFANIKLSRLETFAGDVKRVKVFRTSDGDISDYDLIQDILVESKELLTSYTLSGSVVGQTGIITSETLKNYWNTGSLNAYLTSSKVESGVRLTGSGYFTYSSSLDIKNKNTYELSLDAFYSSSTASNLGIYLSYVSSSTTFTSSLTTLTGTQPTKNLLDTIIPFKIDRDYPSASLYFSQSQGEWHLGNISLKLSQDTAFSPDEISFVTTMPTDINNQTYNFKFEFYDVNNNYVPVAVTQSAVFTGGNAGATAKLLTFQTDRSAFRFSTGSYGNPVNQTVKFSTQKTNLTGSVTYASSAFDVGGNYIEPSNYISTATLQYPADPTKWIYPGWFTSQNQNGALLSIASFSGSVTSSLVGSIVYTASCEGFEEYETIYRFEDGDNAPGVFVTSNTNQFIYKATDLSLNPTGQVITIEAKRKNLASAITPLTINIQSSSVLYPAPLLTQVGPSNPTNGVDTYIINGSNFPYITGETTYFISGSDQFGNEFSDAIKISPVKILDGFSIAASNENTSFPANSAGSVIGGFVASSGSITVKVGNEVISYASPISNNKFSASISSTSGLTPNTFLGTNYSINALSADSGSLTLLVKYQDGGGTIISSSKEITYSKVKKAAPVLSFIIGNNNQTVTAKSTGAQIDAFVTASFTVNETYDGVTTTKTFTPTSITTTNSYQTGSTTSATLALPNMSTSTDSVDISITGSVVDSESTTRFVFGNISLAKVKKAVPNVIITATPLTQTISATSQSIQVGTLLPVTLNALEGATSVFNSASIISSNFTGTSVPANILTLGSIGDSISAASASISVNFTNSEGTTNNSTILVSAVKVNAGNTGATGSAGVSGSNGNNGNDGKRTSTGQIYYQSVSATAPTLPTATVYTFATNTFTTPTLTSQGWGIGAPTFQSGNTNKYWYSTFTAIETTAGGGTAIPTFSAAAEAINFTGLVTFTSANKITNGVLESNIVPSGSITNHIGGPNVTTIDGGKISTGTITSTKYTLLGSDTVASGSFTAGGTLFNLDNSGSIRSKNFYITPQGDAIFKGSITGGTITIGSNFSVSNAGIVNATGATITGNITATSITATTAGSIAGWSVTSTTLGTGSLRLNSGRPAIEIYSGSSLVVDISSATSLSPINVGGATVGAGTIPYTTSASIQVEVSEETTLLTAYQVDLGADPLYSTGGTVGTFTPTSTGAYETTIVLGGQVSNALGQLEPNGVSPAAAFSFLQASYTIGVSIRQGSSSGTEVANFSYAQDWSQATSGTSFNRSSEPNPTLTGTISVTNGITYYIVPYISTGQIESLTTNGNLDTHSLRATYKTPTITSVSVSRGISKSELVAGGFQVVFNTDRYLRVERLSNADFVSIGGGLTCTGDVTANTSSDRRWKDEIIPIKNPIEKIKKLTGNSFVWKDGFEVYHSNKGLDYGVIAQEVEEVMPEIVIQRDGGYKGVRYEKIIPLLIEAIKEQQKQIEELKKE